MSKINPVEALNKMGIEDNSLCHRMIEYLILPTGPSIVGGAEAGFSVNPLPKVCVGAKCKLWSKEFGECAEILKIKSNLERAI